MLAETVPLSHMVMEGLRRDLPAIAYGANTGLEASKRGTYCGLTCDEASPFFELSRRPALAPNLSIFAHYG
jgi:hypothetical protein